MTLTVFMHRMKILRKATWLNKNCFMWIFCVFSPKLNKLYSVSLFKTLNHSFSFKFFVFTQKNFETTINGNPKTALWILLYEWSKTTELRWRHKRQTMTNQSKFILHWQIPNAHINSIARQCVIHWCQTKYTVQCTLYMHSSMKSLSMCRYCHSYGWSILYNKWNEQV